MTSSPRPSTEFRNWLGQLDDSQLAELLRLRPDVAIPLPPGIAPLAVRLQMRSSISRALAQLNTLELAVLEAAALAGAELEPVTIKDITARVTDSSAVKSREHSVDSAQINTALDSLLAYGLVFTPRPDTFMLIGEAMAALPTGWSILQQSHLPPNALESLSDSQISVLKTLSNAAGLGTTRDAAADADPSRPVPQLIAQGLLTRVDSTTVRLPHAVRQLLNGETPTVLPLTQPPHAQREPNTAQHEPNTAQREPNTAQREPENRGTSSTPIPTSIDESATAAALETVRLMENLIEVLGAAPLPLLKDKSLGVRPMTTLAKQLRVDTEHVKFLIALGMSARLLNRGEPSGGPEGNFLAPTKAALDWMEEELSTRWARLALAGSTSQWTWWTQAKPLEDGTTAPYVKSRRDKLLGLLARVNQELIFEELSESFRFHFPVIAFGLAGAELRAYLFEAEALGLAVHNRGTSLLDDLLAGDEKAFHATATALTPAAVSQVIVQTDMTLLSPGPLDTASRAMVELFADVESPGLAAVYRITDSTIRRALDSGKTAAELLTWLEEHSLGPVPQTVEFALSDAARSHGSLRGGPAAAYIRCDDEALLAQAVSAVSSLRLLAPTVAISSVPLSKVIAELHSAGFSPAAEDNDGASIDIRPAPSVLPTPPASTKRSNPSALPESRIVAAVDAIRAHESGQDLNASPPQEEPQMVLRAAIRGGRTVTVHYTDKNGTPQTVAIKPLTVAGGHVDAVRAGTNQALRFPLHRIADVEI